MANMKKVGLVGGIGPESTISYYHDIVYGVQKEVRRDFFPEVSIESIDLFKWVDLCDKKEYDKLVDYTMKPIERLAASGADFAVLTANTAHLIFDQVQFRSPIPLISIVEATAEEAARRGYSKVGILGTGFTMKNDFFKVPFRKYGIEVVIPGEEDMAFIHKKIYEELVYEKIVPATRDRLLNISRQMVQEQGIQGLVLGCTELPTILNSDITPVPCLDTVKIHVSAIIREIMKD